MGCPYFKARATGAASEVENACHTFCKQKIVVCGVTVRTEEEAPALCF